MDNEQSGDEPSFVGIFNVEVSNEVHQCLVTDLFCSTGDTRDMSSTLGREYPLEKK